MITSAVLLVSKLKAYGLAAGNEYGAITDVMDGSAGGTSKQYASLLFEHLEAVVYNYRPVTSEGRIVASMHVSIICKLYDNGVCACGPPAEATAEAP